MSSRRAKTCTISVRAVKVDLPFPRPDFLIPKTNFFCQMEPTPPNGRFEPLFTPPIFSPAAGFWEWFSCFATLYKSRVFPKRSAAAEKKDWLLSIAKLKQANDQLSVRQTELSLSQIDSKSSDSSKWLKQNCSTWSEKMEILEQIDWILF